MAVGPTFQDIRNYHVVVNKNLRFQFSSVKEALKGAFSVYWALDVEYPFAAAKCYMVLQRAVFRVIAESDADYRCSLPVRELVLALTTDK